MFRRTIVIIIVLLGMLMCYDCSYIFFSPSLYATDCKMRVTMITLCFHVFVFQTTVLLLRTVMYIHSGVLISCRGSVPEDTSPEYDNDSGRKTITHNFATPAIFSIIATGSAQQGWRRKTRLIAGESAAISHESSMKHAQPAITDADDTAKTG